jgi:DNA polymerase zeta
LHAGAHHGALGIDFHSVITRGSQYRVESMLLRLCRTQDYVLASPDKKQVSTLDDH